jgi:hypothetical protein
MNWKGDAMRVKLWKTQPDGIHCDIRELDIPAVEAYYQLPKLLALSDGSMWVLDSEDYSYDSADIYVHSEKWEGLTNERS